MTTFVFENYATTLLDSSIGTGDITVNITTGDGALFPSPASGEGFHILVTEGSTTEWMICTARSSDALTVTRSDSPSAFNAGATIKHIIKDDALNNFLQKGDHREVVTSPDGSLSANFVGEEVLDTVTSIWWKNVSGTTWKAINE